MAIKNKGATMKNSVLKIGLTVLFLKGAAFASGIPVFDGASQAQQINSYIQDALEFAKEAQRWSETATHYKDQLEAYAKELEAKTGIRDARKFLKRLENIYEDAKDLGTSIDSLGANWENISQLDKKAQKLMEKYFKTSPCDKIEDSIDKSLCEVQNRHIAKEAVFNEQARVRMEYFADQFNAIAKDMQTNKGAKDDLKQSLDYANAINLLNAKMNAEKNRIELEQAQLKKQGKLQEKAEILQIQKRNVEINKSVWE